MIRSVRNLTRLISILRTLARRDALFFLDQPPLNGFLPARVLRVIARVKPEPDSDLANSSQRPGERLADALHELGPSFIKLGQALSIRSDILGDEVSSDLARLQDSLPPFDVSHVYAEFEVAFGQPVSAMFDEFADEPVAAASIAQVHLARTTADDFGPSRDVAVKVLRPGVEDAFERDLDLFRWVAEILHRGAPSLRRLKLPEVVRTFQKSVQLELDLRLEAAAASELRENFANHPRFHVPEVDWIKTSQRIMTMERIDGIRVSDRDALLAAGVDLDGLLATAAESFFHQVFRDGFFHADMHPGNLFVHPGRVDPQTGVRSADILVPVDFGIMGRLDTDSRKYLAEMLLGFLSGDYKRVSRVHFKAGYVPGNKSIEEFTQACRSIGEPIMGRPMSEISLAHLLAQLFKVTKQFEMETQPQLLLLQKTMLQAEGMGRLLSPSVNMWELARPLVETWIAENLGPQARVIDAASQFVGQIERLPHLMDQLDNAAAVLSGERSGRKRPRFEGYDADDGPGGRSPITALWIIIGVLLVFLFALL